MEEKAKLCCDRVILTISHLDFWFLGKGKSKSAMPCWNKQSITKSTVEMIQRFYRLLNPKRLLLQGKHYDTNQNHAKSLKAQGRILCYLPYGFGNLESGSRVRPYKMYQAFLQLGYQVDLISGTPKERLAKYREILKNGENYAFCYAEASTYPLNPFVDYRILLGIHKRKIPIGVFYRDAYWKFKDYFAYKGLKRIELLLRYRVDLLFLARFVAVVFFPTQSLADLFNFRVPKVILPPAGEYKALARAFNLPLRAVYVGGITRRYGIGIMLEALKMINDGEVKVVLELVCRESEMDTLSPDLKGLLREPWVSISHISGDALTPIYARSHVGLIPLLKDAYNDLAMPVKLFDYLSFGLPVVVTDCVEMAEFVQKHQCGLVCKDTPTSLADAISALLEENTWKEVSSHAERALLAGNLWEDRARLVAQYLNRRS